jgi:hypothetical protein
MAKYGCVASHTIPGVHGSNVLTAPPLVGISQRSYLAGMLENTQEICGGGYSIRATLIRARRCRNKA